MLLFEKNIALKTLLSSSMHLIVKPTHQLILTSHYYKKLFQIIVQRSVCCVRLNFTIFHSKAVLVAVITVLSCSDLSVLSDSSLKVSTYIVCKRFCMSEAPNDTICRTLVCVLFLKFNEDKN